MMESGPYPSQRAAVLSAAGVAAAIIAGLYLSSLYSYLLFHSLIEAVTAGVAFAVAMLTWNTSKYLQGGYLRFIGIGYGFIAFIDLVHTLGYKGVGVFPGGTANLPTQLWIAARYLQAVTLFLAPFLVERGPRKQIIAIGYSAAVAALIAAAFGGYFPDCFVDGKGLTTFKIASEYIISGILCIALFLLHWKRRHFSRTVYRLIAASIIFTIMSELAFTAYVSVYGPANMIGHYFKLAEFYLIYRAILVTGIEDPFAVIFRELKQTGDALRESRDTLEEKVKERTETLARTYRDLQESEAQYRRIVNTANEGIWVLDANMSISFVNGQLAQMLGYAPADLIGRPLTDFIFEEDIPDHNLKIGNRRLGKPEHYERRLRRKNGEAVWTLVSGTPILDGDGRFQGAFAMLTDITARKRAEDELRHHKDLLETVVMERTAELKTAIARLERSNRDLDEFAYIASHDLKEPLRGIHNYVSFLQEDYASKLDDDGRTYLDRMQRLAERLTALIDSLLAYSRLSNRPLPMETVDMEAVLDSVAADLEHSLASSGVELRRAGRLPKVKGNAMRLGEALQNLIGNAVKYNDKAEKWVEVGCDIDRPVPVFYVRDNGIGIPEQHHETVFRIFKRLHEQSKYGGGTGAGLTIVKKIVERHGGRIWLESTPGEGTTFYFTLSGGT